MPSSGGGSGTPVTTPTSTSAASLDNSTCRQQLLPLDTFRRILGYNPWHFWRLAGAGAPITSACNTIVYKYAWQGANAAGREDISYALQTAQSKLTDALGYSPIPHWCSETLPWPRYHDKRQIRWANGWDARGQRIPVTLTEGKVIAVGVETTTLIQAAVAVTYSDPDGDTLNEKFTVTVATAVLDVKQIAVYFAVADRVGAFEGNRVLPVSVSISAGTATITGGAWLLVKPILQEPDSGGAIDPATAGNFASTVDIYWKFTNRDGTTTDTSQAVLSWESIPCPCDCGCTTPSNSSDPAAVAQAVARAGIRNAETGIVVPGESTYDATNAVWSNACSWYREPDTVTVRFFSGVPTQVDGQVSDQWARIITALAAAELSERICACENANRELSRWQFDMTYAGGGDERYNVSSRTLDCPFGTRRGQVWAWQQIQPLLLSRGILP